MPSSHHSSSLDYEAKGWSHSLILHFSNIADDVDLSAGAVNKSKEVKKLYFLPVK